MRDPRPSQADGPTTAPEPTAPRRLAIIGAGPVGLALGLMAARHCPDWSVSVFDARPLEAETGGDSRTLALSHGSLQVLARLGAWPVPDHEPILEVQVTQAPSTWAPGGQLPRVDIRATELGVPQLGAVLAYGRLVPTLQAAWVRAVADAPDRLHHRFGHAVAGLKIRSSGERPVVEVDAGVVDTFDLAVVAEGGVFMRDRSPRELNIESDGRRAAGPAWRHDYGQTAWVGTVELSGSATGRAIEHFSRQGPVALLPLPTPADTLRIGRRRASLVWCVKAEDDPVAGLLDAQRQAVLNGLLPPGAGRIEHIGPLKSFALGLQAQASLVREDCLVRIGNAAQTLHPVAGQGLNLGLRDAVALVERLRWMDRRGWSLARALRGVQWARAADRWTTIAATDFLARSFTWALPGAATARALGLMAVQHLPGLKPALARQMMFGRR